MQKLAQEDWSVKYTEVRLAEERLKDTQKSLEWNINWQTNLDKEEAAFMEKEKVEKDALDALHEQFRALTSIADKEIASSMQHKFKFPAAGGVQFVTTLLPTLLIPSLGSIARLAIATPLIVSAGPCRSSACATAPPRNTASLMWG